MADETVEPAAAPRYNVNIYLYKNDVQRQWLGGAADVPSAITLASGWFQTAQMLYPTVGVSVGVVDVSLTLVATIGWPKTATPAYLG